MTTWNRLPLALICLEAVLLACLWTFGGGRVSIEPYAGWLTPAGEAITHSLPKFRLMASKLEEMGLSNQVNLVPVAFGISYAAQPLLAAL